MPKMIRYQRRLSGRDKWTTLPLLEGVENKIMKSLITYLKNNPHNVHTIAPIVTLGEYEYRSILAYTV